MTRGSRRTNTKGKAEDMAPPRQEVAYVVTDAMILSRNWNRKAAPFYSVHLVAQVFFAMSSSWLRLKLNSEPGRPNTSFVGEDGKRMEIRRRNPSKSDSARVFTLADVERMARSLAGFGDISQARLAQILRLVEAEATLYGLFDEAPEEAAS
jgi:hypothetical protein